MFAEYNSSIFHQNIETLDSNIAIIITSVSNEEKYAQIFSRSSKFSF